MPDPLDRRLAALRNRPFEPTPLAAITARAVRLRRRRRQRGAAGGLLAAGLAAGLLAAAPLGGGRSVTVTTTPPGPPAAHGNRALGGELAYVTGSRLTIVDRSGARHAVRLSGGGLPSGPAWSADGRWLAFYLLPPTTASYGPPGTLWLVRADGTDLHPLGTALQFAWDPRSDTLAYIRGNAVELARVAGPGVSLAPLGALGAPESLAWSPSGHALAVGTVASTKAGGTGRLVVLRAGTQHASVLATSHAYGFDVASWWPDGKGLLYWQQQAFSASIAADGLPLTALDTVTGRAHVLATTLAYRDWFAWSPDGRTLAVVAGADRVVWDGAKHLLLCRVPSGGCVRVTQPRGRTSIDPAWTTFGQLLFARSTGTTAFTMGPPPGIPGVPRSQPFGWRAVAAWAAAGRLEGLDLTGRTTPATPVAVTGGRGGQEPTPAGANVLFVRAGELWWIPAGAVEPSQLTGRLGPYGPSAPGYYGYIDWRQEFAWHA